MQIEATESRFERQLSASIGIEREEAAGRLPRG
jgi:hypothetical protein